MGVPGGLKNETRLWNNRPLGWNFRGWVSPARSKALGTVLAEVADGRERRDGQTAPLAPRLAHGAAGS